MFRFYPKFIGKSIRSKWCFFFFLQCIVSSIVTNAWNSFKIFWISFYLAFTVNAEYFRQNDRRKGKKYSLIPIKSAVLMQMDQCGFCLKRTFKNNSESYYLYNSRRMKPSRKFTINSETEKKLF